jgi:hypothetical protein
MRVITRRDHSAPPNNPIHQLNTKHHAKYSVPNCIPKANSRMAEQSIRSLFASAEHQRKDIEASWETNTTTYQENLAAAIATYDDCLKLADRLSLFSPNETLEDLTSGDLQYLCSQKNTSGRALLTPEKVSCDQLSPCRTHTSNHWKGPESDIAKGSGCV